MSVTPVQSLWYFGDSRNASVLENNSDHQITNSDVFIHPHWNKFAPLSSTTHILFGIFAAIVAILAIIGNVMVISIFVRYKSVRSPSTLFLLNLSIADLVMAIGNLPVYSISSFHETWIIGNIGCQIYGVFGSVGSLVSLHTLTMIALERAIVIADTFFLVRKSTYKTVVHVIICMWIYSAIWAISPVLGWGRYILEGAMVSCTFDFLSEETVYKSFVIALLIVCFFIPMIIIILSYVTIYIKVANHEMEIKNLSERLNIDSFLIRMSNKRRKQNREIKIAKIAFCMIVAFCIAWLPYATVTMIACFGNPNLIGPMVSAIPGLFAKCATAVNPVFYALLHPKFKNKYLQNMPLRSLFLHNHTSLTTENHIDLHVHSYSSIDRSPHHIEVKKLYISSPAGKSPLSSTNNPQSTV